MFQLISTHSRQRPVRGPRETSSELEASKAGNAALMDRLLSSAERRLSAVEQENESLAALV